VNWQIIFSENKWVLPLAYLFGVLGGHILIGQTLSIMWELLRLEARMRNFPTPIPSASNPFVRYTWQVAAVGVIERTPYIMTLQIGRPEFIAVWLTLKTLVQARRWNEEDINPGRAVYNNFLAGSGLSIMYAFVASAVIQWAAGPSIQRDYVSAITAPVMLILANALLLFYLQRQRQQIEIEIRQKEQKPE